MHQLIFLPYSETASNSASSLKQGVEIKSIGNTRLFGHIKFDDLDVLSEKTEKVDILPEIEKLSKRGSFALIVDKENSVELAVDCFRTIPLFYHISSDAIYVSDNADLIAQRVNASIIEDNLRELYYIQCVTEANETIYKDIFVVNAGTIVSVSKEDGSVTERTYYEPIYRFDSDASVEDLIEEYDVVLKNAFSRLVEKLSGRPILVPLSKGFDSRTVATTLKRIGYDNVYCFSYGIPSSSECAISKEVANNLGYPWLYTEYSGKVWKKLYESETYQNFLKFSCKGISIGCTQALPAILNISKKKLVPDDTVVTPGHTDVAFGSFLKTIKEGNYTQKDMMDWVAGQYYSQIGGKEILQKRTWITKLPLSMNIQEYCKEYMRWSMTKRQPGFIINDVRTYEFAGYAFDLPLLDRDVMSFWHKVPLPLLYKRTLQIMYTRAKLDPVTKVESKLPNLQRNVPIQLLKTVIKRCMPGITSKILRKRKLTEYDSSENAFYSFMPKDRYEQYIKQYGNTFTLNSVVAENYEKIIRNLPNLPKKDFSL